MFKDPTACDVKLNTLLEVNSRTTNKRNCLKHMCCDSILKYSQQEEVFRKNIYRSIMRKYFWSMFKFLFISFDDQTCGDDVNGSNIKDIRE